MLKAHGGSQAAPFASPHRRMFAGRNLHATRMFVDEPDDGQASRRRADDVADSAVTTAVLEAEWQRGRMDACSGYWR